MPKLTVTGAWVGRYGYDPVEGAGAFPTAAFRMCLKQSWLIGSFQGVE